MSHASNGNWYGSSWSTSLLRPPPACSAPDASRQDTISPESENRSVRMLLPMESLVIARLSETSTGHNGLAAYGPTSARYQRPPSCTCSARANEVRLSAVGPSPDGNRDPSLSM